MVYAAFTRYLTKSVVLTPKVLGNFSTISDTQSQKIASLVSRSRPASRRWDAGKPGTPRIGRKGTGSNDAQYAGYTDMDTGHARWKIGARLVTYVSRGVMTSMTRS